MFNCLVQGRAPSFCRLLSILTICTCLAVPASLSLSFGAETFVLKHPVKTVTLTGFTRARSSMTVTSEVGGRCLSVSADVGDVIEASVSFIQIDPIFILLDIQANKLAQEKLQRKIVLNKQELHRYQNLYTKHSISQAQLDKVSLQHDISNIELKRLVNEGDKLREIHRRHTITAPQGYRIIGRFVEPGELISTGQKLATLGNYKERLLPLVLTYDEYKALLNLTPIRVFLPDLDLTLTAEFLRITPGFDEKSRKIKVDLLIPEQEIRKIQSFQGSDRVLIRITIQDRMGPYIVPKSALHERHGSYWLSGSDGTKKDVVLLGDAELKDHLLVSGELLKPGEHFLIHPNNVKSRN